MADVFSIWYGVAKRLLRYRRWCVAALEGVITATALVTAFLLRFDFSVPELYWQQMCTGAVIGVSVKLLVSHGLGVHLHSFRYVSVRDLVRLSFVQMGVCLSTSLVVSTLYPNFPRSIHLLNLMLAIGLAAASRAGSMLASEFMNSRGGTQQLRNTLIYGAGSAGVALLRELRNNVQLRYGVKGFVDDQMDGTGLLIHGTRVLGRGVDLPELVSRYKVEVVLIAIPSATGTEMAEILENCRRAGVKSLTMPGIADVMEGKGLARQLRDVAVEDLLGRSPVRLEQDRIRDRHQGRTVLVTGAAGSIGSELCRQIARFEPGRLLGLDTAESGLFDLEQELRSTYRNLDFRPLVGSIRNTQRLEEIFRVERPSIVYHAAAYKHVPMMESHVFEAVENNVLGTLNVATAAGRNGVEDFVMISSDKAVRPTNIMGATKRLAEMVIRSLRMGQTKYVSVRFGNVLGSNGSVVPIFKKQIARGGPVMVTHPEMRRYFMTIPEASQLVLQSATMGQGGEIFVLDMGDPVKIVDLARNLILLSGLKPGEDIQIEFSGIRPGEKLYEELSGQDEQTRPTYHDKIKIFSSAGENWFWMEQQLRRLEELCALRQYGELIFTLKDLVPEYNPSSDLLRRAAGTRKGDLILADGAVEALP